MENDETTIEQFFLQSSDAEVGRTIAAIMRETKLSRERVKRAVASLVSAGKLRSRCAWYTNTRIYSK